LSPAEDVSTPGQDAKTCSAVGLRRRFWLQMKSTFFMVLDSSVLENLAGFFAGDANCVPQNSQFGIERCVPADERQLIDEFLRCQGVALHPIECKIFLSADLQSEHLNGDCLPFVGVIGEKAIFGMETALGTATVPRRTAQRSGVLAPANRVPVFIAGNTS
jgi:hypothetical protein